MSKLFEWLAQLAKTRAVLKWEKGNFCALRKGSHLAKMNKSETVSPLSALRKQLERVDCDTKLPALAFPYTLSRNASLALGIVQPLIKKCTLCSCLSHNGNPTRCILKGSKRVACAFSLYLFFQLHLILNSNCETPPHLTNRAAAARVCALTDWDTRLVCYYVAPAALFIAYCTRDICTWG